MTNLLKSFHSPGSRKNTQQTPHAQKSLSASQNSAVSNLLDGGWKHSKSPSHQMPTAGQSKNQHAPPCPQAKVNQVRQSFIAKGIDPMTAQFKAMSYLQSHGCKSHVRIVQPPQPKNARPPPKPGHPDYDAMGSCPKKRLKVIQSGFIALGDDIMTAHFRTTDFVQHNGCYGELPKSLGSKSTTSKKKTKPCTYAIVMKKLIAGGLDAMTAHYKAADLIAKGQGCKSVVGTPAPPPPTPSPCSAAQIQYWLVKKGLNPQRAMYIAQGGVSAAISVSGGGTKKYFCGKIPTPSPTPFPTPLPTNASVPLFKPRPAKSLGTKNKNNHQLSQPKASATLPPPSADNTKMILSGLLSMLLMGYCISGCNYALDKMNKQSSPMKLPETVHLSEKKRTQESQQVETWQKSASTAYQAEDEVTTSRYQTTTSYADEYNPDYSGGLSDDDVCPDVI